MSTGTIRVAPVIAPVVKDIQPPSSWIKSIAFIKQLILDNNILISLLGEQGSGKSSFISTLQTFLPSKIKSNLIVADASFDKTIFLQQLGELLDISDEASIAHFITQKNKQKSHALLIVDDAHFLPADFIEEILNAIQQQGKTGHFHVCLVSNFSLVPALNKLAQNAYQDMIHSLEIGVLTESETKAYLIQNMRPLPGTEKIITDERVQQFFQLTGGHIEKINSQMTDFFSYQPTKESKLAILRYVSIAAGVFLAVSGGVYLWLSQDFQPAPAQLVSVRAPVELVDESPALISDIPSYEIAATRQPLEPVLLRRADLAMNSEDDDTLNDDLVVMDKVVVAPKVVQVKEEALPASDITPAKISPAAKKIVKPLAKAAVIKPVVDQSRYTIQLLASHNIAELKRFAEIHHVKGKTTIHTTQRQGTAWYVLTWGEYSNRQYAKDAASHLPYGIAQFKPWVRSLSELKKTS